MRSDGHLLNRLKNNGKPLLKLSDSQLQIKEKIDSKVNNYQFEFEEVACACCNSTNFEQIGLKDRYGLYYSTRICTDCGLVYTGPRMTQNSYNDFYKDDYRILYNSGGGGVETFFNAQKLRAEKIYDFVLKHSNVEFKEGATVLEVGCGAGGILAYFQEKGFKTLGIDLGEDYLNYGRKKYNLDLRAATLQNLKIDFKPDLIIYSHVLEHILDLKQEFELINQISSESALIYIEVPGLKWIHKKYRMNILRYFQNAHTFHFTLTSLVNILKNNGFGLLQGDEFIHSLFVKTGKSESQIKNDLKATRSYIKNVDRFRFLSPFISSYYKKRLLKLLLKLR